MLVSSSAKLMSRTILSRAYVQDQSPCQKIKNGTILSRKTSISLILEFQCDKHRISITLVVITSWLQKFVLVCWNVRASILKVIQPDGKLLRNAMSSFADDVQGTYYRLLISTNSNLQTRPKLPLCHYIYLSRSLDLTLLKVDLQTNSCLKAAKQDLCIVAIPGCFVPRVMIP